MYSLRTEGPRPCPTRPPHALQKVARFLSRFYFDGCKQSENSFEFSLWKSCRGGGRDCKSKRHRGGQFVCAARRRIERGWRKIVIGWGKNRNGWGKNRNEGEKNRNGYCCIRRCRCPPPAPPSESCLTQCSQIVDGSCARRGK